MKAFFLGLILITNTLLAISQNASYSFFVAGHTYGTPEKPSVGLYDSLVKFYPYIQNRSEIKFGVFTGDIVGSATNQSWNEVDNDIAELGLPIYFAVGNHDMYNRTLFEQRYGPTYYSFIYNNDLFFVLDPNIDSWNINQAQLTMIKDTLQKYNSQIENIFIFFHQVIWWSKNNIYKNVVPNSTEGRADSINFWTDVEPLFYQNKAKVVMFAGDVGATNASFNIMYDSYENITLIASGMGNKIADNFIVVNIDDTKKITFDLISIDKNNMNSLGNIKSYDKYFNPHSTNIEKRIYPNPVFDFVTFENLNYSKVDIFDLNGRFINEFEIDQDIININLSYLQRGIYVFKFISDSSTFYHKFIKY